MPTLADWLAAKKKQKTKTKKIINMFSSLSIGQAGNNMF